MVFTIPVVYAVGFGIVFAVVMVFFILMLAIWAYKLIASLVVGG